MTLDDTIMGYPVRQLLVVAEMLRSHDIDEIDLRNSTDLYVMGYKDGQAFVGSTIKKTMDGYKAEMTFGKPFASLDESVRDIGNSITVGKYRGDNNET